ncbi:MAG: hypothetical protein WC277_09560 [Bacilli bacterium]
MNKTHRAPGGGGRRARPWCVLARMPEQDALDLCDRVLWNAEGRTAGEAMGRAREELAEKWDTDPGDVEIVAASPGRDSITLPWW